MPTVGFLHSGSSASHGGQYAAFLRGLAEAGYVDGDNVTVTPVWADDDRQKLQTNANAFVTAAVDVIAAAGGSASAVAAKTATAANPIPVVFTAVADPIASGLVTSLDKPGGNLTGTAGLTSELDAKRLELLHELCPAQATISVLTNSTRPKFVDQMADLQAAAARIGVALASQDATKPADIDNAFNAFAGNGQPVLVTADPLFNNQRKKVIKAAKTKKLPAIYQWREFAAAGGLMSYGPSIDGTYQQAGSYTGQILDGDKPQNLPVMLPNKLDLVINMRTAHQLRNDIQLKIPGSLLARAVLLRHK